MKKFISSIFLSINVLIIQNVSAQGVAVGAGGGNPDPSAMFEVQSTNKGLLPPRMTTAQRDAIALPAEGLQIYNLDCHTLNFNAGTPESPEWVTVSSSNSLPASVTISAAPSGTVCENTSVIYSALVINGGGSPTYQWKKNNVAIPGETNPVYTNPSPVNGDAISCILTSDAPCISNATATSNIITEVVNSPSAVTVSITADPAGAVCEGTTVNFYSTPSNG
ncbi:MAG: hypothetical protein IT223_11380 [Crocinitomicaceae bacterium]|nr:hypothetical protein [Crocinitomicaceae bacterium]